ncbi:MAG TPA: peptide-methionine (S)-S-oxide reductase MsrA, partial [Isosphaeraceae bacterium]|nr:peptide-methionine (S)-S-oxide reductase MsrA [Isosphaeraceae bacterium]
MKLALITLVLISAVAMLTLASVYGPGQDVPRPPGVSKPKEEKPVDPEQAKTWKTATVGGGCFWCVEAVFQELKGVKKVVSGYAGGEVPNPTYRQVCSGTTGHAEVAQITYDPAEVTFPEILEVFWKTHDPTTRNRQGADVGPQYRSIILYEDDQQKREAEELKANLDESGAFDAPIVTEIVPLEHFYPAEDYHQDYYRQNSSQPYCQFV